MRIPKPFQRTTGPHAGTWYLQVNRRKVITLGKDEAKAKTKANALLREYAAQGVVASATDPTFHELIDEYVAWVAVNRAPSKTEVTQYFWRDLKAATSPTLKASKVKPLLIEKFINGRPSIKSPTTKHDYITLVIGMYNWGKRFGLVDANPIEEMPKPKRRVRQDFLPADKFQTFLDLLGNDNIHDFFVVMLESGARTQEMFKATAAEFHDGDKLVFDIEDSKGERSSRVIYLPPLAAEIVARLVKQYPEGPIFRNTLGAPWNKDSINCHMRRLKVKLGMPSLCATLLRHSYAHYRLTNGQDALVVAKLMGHKDTRMLAKRYGHLEGSSFLAAKANELTMPLARDRAVNGEQAAKPGSESNGHADDAVPSNGKARRRKS